MLYIIPSVIETPFQTQISAEGTFADIQRLVARWKVGYDWRQHESWLNEDLSQFKWDIRADGFGTLGIHTHKKSEVPDATTSTVFRCYSLMGLSKEFEKGL